MFAKLLTLSFPVYAISIVTPIVLTSCGSSSSEANKTQTSWDTTKTQGSLTFDTTNNIVRL